MAFDSSINGPILAAKCGVDDKSFWLCWFKPSLKSGHVKFNLIDKAQVQKDYDANKISDFLEQLIGQNGALGKLRGSYKRKG